MPQTTQTPSKAAPTERETLLNIVTYCSVIAMAAGTLAAAAFSQLVRGEKKTN